jgi:uncharacterized membrane protein
MEPAGEFRIGRVLSRALTITSRNLVQFAVIVGIPLLPLLAFSPALTSPKPNFQGMGGTFALSIIVTLILSALSQVVVIHAAFQSMRGRPISIADSLSKGLARFLPVIGLSIMIALGVFFGILLLVVPGFILLSMWYVALPACVVESLPVFGSMRRSADLTKGYRWQVFGIYVLLAILSGVLGAIVSGIFTGLFGILIGAIARFAVQVIMGAFQAVVVVVAYHDLRAAKEGVDIDRIAAVFD